MVCGDMNWIATIGGATIFDVISKNFERVLKPSQNVYVHDFNR